MKQLIQTYDQYINEKLTIDSSDLYNELEKVFTSDNIFKIDVSNMRLSLLYNGLKTKNTLKFRSKLMNEFLVIERIPNLYANNVEHITFYITSKTVDFKMYISNNECVILSQDSRLDPLINKYGLQILAELSKYYN